MNIPLWILQVLLALHTFIGAVWKLSNSEQGLASLQAIPHGAWVALTIVELVCSVGLVLPLVFRNFVPKPVVVAAACIAGEMLFFCAVLLFTGSKEYDHFLYWLVVAALCAFVAYGRWKLSPL